MAHPARVVFLSVGDGSSRAHCSGLALQLHRTLPPLVLTLADVGEARAGVVGVAPEDGQVCRVDATLIGDARVSEAEVAFRSLATRGWHCSSQRSRRRRADGHFRVSLWRCAAALPAGPAPRVDAAWRGPLPDEGWVGASVCALACPFGGLLAGGAVTHGVVSNVSDPPGLLLFDARCVDGSTGGAVVLKGARVAVAVACIAPLLQSRSGDAVAVSVAVPLPLMLSAIRAEASCFAELSAEECRFFAPAERPARGFPHPHPSATSRCGRAVASCPCAACAARRGVVLLWLASTGSWASAVVVSESGYLLTNAHLLTGHSWMEELAASDGGDKAGDVKEFPPPLRPSKSTPRPANCRGRGFVLDGAGGFEDVTFEAEVLHIHEGCLDVALVRARPSAGRRELRFRPMRWHAGPCVREGAAVWAVGHGLFGPGTPWLGPTVTAGHVAKVALGPTGRAAVIQSTAAVHRGCSGGALVDVACGSLLGLITTNVKQHDGAIMPQVNFSLPVNHLRPLRDFLEGPGGAPGIERLAQEWEACAADEQERRLWRLEPERVPLPSRMEAGKRQALRLMQHLAEEAERLAANPPADIQPADADASASSPPKATATAALRRSAL